jgi:hypothetical protein
MDKADLKQDKKMIAGAVHKHEKRLHKGMAPTKFKNGGVAGVSGDAMKAVGRNMARANNQRGR